MAQVLPGALRLPPVVIDFWTGAYQAIEDRRVAKRKEPRQGGAPRRTTVRQATRRRTSPSATSESPSSASEPGSATSVVSSWYES